MLYFFYNNGQTMKKFGAFIIDIFFGLIIFGYTVANYYDKVTGSKPESKISDLGLRDIIGLIFLVTFILSYMFIFEKLFGGTMGQRILKINRASK
jgi:hypothetical protein